VISRSINDRGGDYADEREYARVLVAALIAAQASIGLTLPAREQAASNHANCRAFTAEVIIGGQPQQAVGQACQQTFRTGSTMGRSFRIRRQKNITVSTLSNPSATEWN